MTHHTVHTDPRGPESPLPDADRETPGGAIRGGMLARSGEVLWKLGASVWHGLYDHGIRRPARLPVPVISVGNLTVGGTGKTPVVEALGGAALRGGYRPVILTRGYGGRDPEGVLHGGRRRREPAEAHLTGDEPLQLSRALPRVPVAVGKDRSESASRLLASGEPVDLFILDDGFQHRRLARDADVVLLDALRPLGNGHQLPAGPLREGKGALRRATHVLITGTPREFEGTLEAELLLDAIRPDVPRRRVWTELRALKLLTPSGEGGLETIAPAGLRAHVVAGIARPRRFRGLLEAAGAEVAGFSTYRDHHVYRRSEIQAEERAALDAGAVPVTTTKDAVRMERLVDPTAGWLVVDVGLEIEGGWDAFLEDLLRSP